MDSKDFENSIQIPIDFEVVKWPPQEEFPLNIKLIKRTTEAILHKDIQNSTDYLIITGFTSLSNLVDLFGSKDFEKLNKVRILIGFEPNLRGRKSYQKFGLDKEIKDYWLKNRFSIMQGGAVINLINKIENSLIEFKFKDKLHAKIYVGDEFAILGSSNFSRNGLTSQEEANIRVKNSKDRVSEKKQYDSIKLIAESYYEEATPYNNKIIELLKELIKEVTWEEALARAIAEILEGDWLNEYKEILGKLEQIKLWPTQWKGLAQAVSILQRQSNVLIADPTGAGKTKLCTSVILSLKHWLYEIGKNYSTNSLIICPPLVVQKWEDEFRAMKRMNNTQRSMGLLSNASGTNKKKITEELKIANILTIDEAHNYLSPHSNRTALIKDNHADFKILITATPISKKVEDLLRLIELLDIDNLDDKNFELYKELVNKPYKRSRNENVQNLRNFISQFTVRRTKKTLNNEIDKQPEKYLNALNKPCKFPKQIEKTYTTKETKEDKEIVAQINTLIQKIKGITYLYTFHKPNFEISNEDSLEGYIQKRINSGKALSTYMIRAALRSSHVALVEHIEGSDKAMKHFGFSGKTKGTGDKLNKLDSYIKRAKLPIRNPMFKKELFPEWLVEKEAFLKACQEEYEVYSQISNLAKKLSGNREMGKVKQLIAANTKHDNIIAFDSTVITLYYFKMLFDTHFPEQKILVATGNEKDNDSKKVMEVFNLLSTSTDKYIALCSDKMSESIDLQKASCIVLLDLPSVLRIVEQRIGRVDRMDSLNESIEIFWPDDSEEYSLNADSRLIQTNDMVEQIYGSNFNIPENLKERFFEKTESVKSIIKEYKDFVDKDESWTGIHDSFQPISDLKEGPTAIIKEKDYNEFKNVTAEVKTRVSFLESNQNWCFIALRGDKNKSPKWYFIDDKDIIHTDFPDVCQQLRNAITKNVNELTWQEQPLEKYIKLFKHKERELLPPKKKRALEVAEAIIEAKLKSKDISLILRSNLNYSQNLLNSKTEEVVDFERLAEEWIDILQPYLDEKRRANKRKKIILNLSNLKNDYKKIDFEMINFEKLFDKCIIADDVDKRIAACIIGVAAKIDQP